jgi:hypothetical protein
VADSEGHSFKIRLDPEILELGRRQHGHVAAHGTLTVRLTRDRLEQQPDREANRLRTILEQQAAEATAYPKRPVT